jgi:hypothetical protein
MTIVGAKFILDSKRKKLNRTFIFIGFFFVCFTIARIFRLIAEFIIGYEYGYYQFTGLLQIVEGAYTITSYIGLLAIYFFLEKTIVKKTHYLLSSLVIIETIVSILNYYIPELFVIMLALFLIMTLGLPAIFINVALKMPGIVRKKASIVAIGILFFIAGVAFDIPEGTSLWIGIPGFPDITRILAPSLHIITIFLFWKGFHIPFLFEGDIKIDDSTLQFVKNMGMEFSRPEDLTEEEVKFYREQIVCLVCRGDLLGFSHTFFCPNCKALYCESCALALSNLENACWSCDNAIDASKTKKSLKEKPKEIEIEETKHKKKQ